MRDYALYYNTVFSHFNRLNYIIIPYYATRNATRVIQFLNLFISYYWLLFLFFFNCSTGIPPAGQTHKEKLLNKQPPQVLGAPRAATPCLVTYTTPNYFFAKISIYRHMQTKTYKLLKILINRKKINTLFIDFYIWWVIIRIQNNMHFSNMCIIYGNDACKGVIIWKSK